MVERLKQIRRCQNGPLPFGCLFSVILIILGYFLVFPISVSADEAGETPSVSLVSIDFTIGREGINITIQTDGEISRFESLAVENPARIVFDLFDVKSPHKFEQVVPVDTKWVKRIRHYGYPEKLRIVLDTEPDYLSAYLSRQLKSGLHISIGPASKEFSKKSKDAQKPSSKAKSVKGGEKKPKEAPKPSIKPESVKAGQQLQPPAPLADEAGETPSVSLVSIDFTIGREGINITIQTDGESSRFESMAVENPARIVFDLFDVKSPHKYEQAVPVNSEWVQGIRHYGHPEKLRIVLDTRQDYLSHYSSKRQKNGLRITVGKAMESAAERPVPAPPMATVITAKPPEFGEITAFNLNVRSAPDTNATSIGILKKGTRVRILKRTDGWLEIYHESQSGFIRNRERYVNIIKEGEDKAESASSTVPEEKPEHTVEGIKEESKIITREIKDPPSVRLVFIDFTHDREGIDIVIKTDGEIPRVQSIEKQDPTRIVFDLFDVVSPHKFEQVVPVDTKWVKRIRHYGHPEKLRVILDTKPDYLPAYSLKRQEKGLRIRVGKPREPAAEEPKEPPALSREEPIAKSEDLPRIRNTEMVNTHIPDPKDIIGDRIDFQKTDLPSETFNLEQTIKAAITANLGLKIAEEETQAALAVKNRQRSNFLPTLGAQYQYTRNDEGESIGGLATGSENEYEFSTTFEQPIFTGFSLINRFKIAGIELDISELSEEVNRQDIIFQANAAYFNLLKAQKLNVIARQTVEQITAQRDVAKNYLMAGMTPLNSFLQAQVELANAKQESAIAANKLETAITDFNILLRRPVGAKVELDDITAYTPFERKLAYCQETAEKNRLEIEIADMSIQKAEKDLALSKKDYLPSIDLLGTYFRAGTDWDVDGGEGIFDPEGWSVSAMASWDFWEWGRTRYGVKEKLSRLKQARHQRSEILDQIHRQVKQAYLKNLENEINIVTIKTAIDQAKENLRMSQERFKGQAATATDVLIAQTLLTRTMTNYYTALYDFNISKAALYRALGRKSTSHSTPL